MSSELEQLVRVGNDITAIRYYIVATGTVLFYDYLLTLSDEIEYVWSEKKSFASWLFIFNRYFPMTYQLWQLGVSYSPQSQLDKEVQQNRVVPRLLVCRLHPPCTGGANPQVRNPLFCRSSLRSLSQDVCGDDEKHSNHRWIFDHYYLPTRAWVVCGSLCGEGGSSNAPTDTPRSIPCVRVRPAQSPRNHVYGHLALLRLLRLLVDHLLCNTVEEDGTQDFGDFENDRRRCGAVLPLHIHLPFRARGCAVFWKCKHDPLPFLDYSE
ncbi:hypothetical protein BJ322DRAFT_842695 [Thelephora terrestris]|uniref:DUF6533 domain-containing protein n=1 Tax=Thelephora terrestris TaxID=56493 RepID=A0A9P6HD25_9AGAM|nr:hypothetical protein BJ322DRAFT_842695 [Thelephora terrestris]